MLSQRNDVIFSLPERRNMDRHDIQPVIQVLPKAFLLHHLFQVAVSSGDHSDVHLYGFVAAHADERAVLQHMEQFGLHIQRQLADLIQKQRSVICCL